MNQVYFGNHAYGIEAAVADVLLEAREEPDARSRPRCSPGLPQAPSLYDPFHIPSAALARRDEVLRAMYDERRHHRAASTRRRSPTAACT